MLVIKRRMGERIRVGGVEIVITSIEGNKVGIGIAGPRTVDVKRSRPCVVCNEECYDSYLGMTDVPFCGKEQCAFRIRKNLEVKT